MKKIGLIVNPMAGVGGRVGLKGSDGRDIQDRAFLLGAEKESSRRAAIALKALADLTDRFSLLTVPGEMGADAARMAGLPADVIALPAAAETTAEDTVAAAREMQRQQVELIVFAGGDGTARDIFRAIGLVTPALGIPAGVKIHSGVYAVSPPAAGDLLRRFITLDQFATREMEVMDIDEDAFRQDRVEARLYGYLRVPVLGDRLQCVKSGAYSEREALAGIAREIVDNMEDGVYYLIGTGTTPRAIMEMLGLPNSLLGVDIVRDKKLVADNATEKEILAIIAGYRAHIIVTAIGGQGHIFGRGNQQFSPAVIRTVGIENITVIATREKLARLTPTPFFVDTGDPLLDSSFPPYVKVVTGYRNYTPYRIAR